MRHKKQLQRRLSAETAPETFGLLQSLEPNEGSAEIEAAWNTKAAERAKAFDEGKLTERSAAEVLSDARGRVQNR